MNLPCLFRRFKHDEFEDANILDIQLIPAMDCPEGVYIFLISDGYGKLHRIKGHQNVRMEGWKPRDDTPPS